MNNVYNNGTNANAITRDMDQEAFDTMQADGQVLHEDEDPDLDVPILNLVARERGSTGRRNIK